MPSSKASEADCTAEHARQRESVDRRLLLELSLAPPPPLLPGPRPPRGARPERVAEPEAPSFSLGG
eukprot:4886824-Pyramimonas_sp.AAC.1